MDSRKREVGEARREYDGDTIEQVMRERVREAIEAIVEEKLAAALGSESSARVGEERRGIGMGGDRGR